MDVLKFLHFVCILFCLFSYYALVNDSREIDYEKTSKTLPFQYLACQELENLYPSKTEIELEELRNDLYEYLRMTINIYNEKLYPIKELILNLTRSGSYLIINEQACLIANQNELETIRYGLWTPLNRALNFVSINLQTFDFEKMTEWDDKIDQFTVLKKGPPYSDCEVSNSRFFCLNECFKRNFKLSRYFYNSSENGTIQLTWNHRNKTIGESEKTCFRKCHRHNCKLIKLILKEGFKESKTKTETVEARAKLSDTDYWLQLIGLALSFVGISFKKSKVRRRKVRIGLFNLNLFITFLSLAYGGYLGAQVILETNNATIQEMPMRPIQPKIFRLAVCVNLLDYVGYSYTFKNKVTMSEIEEATNEVLNKTLEDIKVTNGERSFRTNYQVHPKTLFFRSFGFYRCFLLAIRPDYQATPSNPKLTLMLRNEYQLFLLTENENLNQNSFAHSGSNAFMKRVVKRLRSGGRCVHYEEKYKDCNGRSNCLDKCFNRKFIERFNRTTFGDWLFGLVIDRDWFNLAEWNTFPLLEIPDENRSIYEDIKTECKNEIPDERPCLEISFERTYQTNQQNRLMEIDLQIDVDQYVEEMPFSYKLTLDLVTIESISFGLTILSLLKMVIQYIPRFRMRKEKQVWFLICLLCSLASSFNTYRIFDLAVNEELNPTKHYEIAKQVLMPEMVFCLEIDQTLIDPNYKLTGNYLEKLTSNITPTILFRNIIYLNGSNEWAYFNLRQAETFFFRGMKCFRIKTDQVYHQNQLHFSIDSQILKLDFTKYVKGKLVYFRTVSKENGELSKIVNFKYTLFSKYSITHETSIQKYEDHFSFIRRNLLTFQEEEVGDFDGQLQSDQLNFRSLAFPVEKADFELELNDDLFQQLSLRKQNKVANLDYEKRLITNHLRRIRIRSEPDLVFNLVFLQKIVHSTNAINYSTLILSLLGLLCTWFEVDMLELRPLYLYLRDYLFGYLFIHLPVCFLIKISRFPLFSTEWLAKLKSVLNKFESALYERVNPHKTNLAPQVLD